MSSPGVVSSVVGPRSKRRIRPERVIDIASEDSRPAPTAEPATWRHTTREKQTTTDREEAETASEAPTRKGRGKRKRKRTRAGDEEKAPEGDSSNQTKVPTADEEEQEEADPNDTLDWNPTPLVPKSTDGDSDLEVDDNGGELDLELYNDDADELEERKESDRRRPPSKKPTSLVGPAAPPLVPFIFHPSHLPSDADRAASARVVQDRLAEFLNGVELVDKTTPTQRAKMSKDRLLQRNLEIQCQWEQTGEGGVALSCVCVGSRSCILALGVLMADCLLPCFLHLFFLFLLAQL